jgi:hypothetical protein
MDEQKTWQNRIRGWLPKESSCPTSQKPPAFGNRLKQYFKIQELPNAAIIIIMVSIFLSFGLIANLFNGYSLTYNLFQGIFMAIFTGAALYGAMIIIRRRKRHKAVSLFRN